VRSWLRRLQRRALGPLVQRLDWLQAEQWRHYRQLEALASIMALIRPRAPLPPFRQWAIGPDLAVLLLGLLIERKPACVVELGSGVSTIVTGYALERWNGRLVSVEHDLQYAAISRAQIARHGLAGVATVVDAPLDATGWYDVEWVQGLPPIDLLVVDGPPGPIGPRARQPAYPRLVKYLAPNAVIVVDDVARPDERAMVEAWIEDDPRLTVVRREPTETGAAVLVYEP
jgi:predicted O-methyltransferase YrrM